MPEENRTQNGDDRSLDPFLQAVASHNPFEEALAELARAIRLGAVPVGEKFPPERELSQRLGVSRTTVREAIRGLEEAGYITTRRGRSGGTFVISDEAALPAEDRRRAVGPQLIETLDFRTAIEPGAAVLAARKSDEEQIEQIRALIETMESETDSSEFVRQNCRLHILFAQAADCPALLKAVTSVELDVMDGLLTMPNLEPSETRSHAQHRKIVDAIAKGKPDDARKAMEVHLAATDLLMREFAAPETAGAS